MSGPLLVGAEDPHRVKVAAASELCLGVVYGDTSGCGLIRWKMTAAVVVLMVALIIITAVRTTVRKKKDSFHLGIFPFLTGLDFSTGKASNQQDSCCLSELNVRVMVVKVEKFQVA